MQEGLFQLLFGELVHNTLQRSVAENSDSPEPDQELAFYRLERVGFHVGQRLIDRILLGHRTFSDQLDVFKFICKDYWNVLFHKPIDNLKTNHKGVYVMQDNNFSWISRFALDIALPDTAKMAVLYLAYPCGLIRGALATLGIQATVTAEIPAFNQCSFQVRVQSSSLP